ncbi:hypothetical protein BBC27_07995 [Acidithiobacillus ferrivorans]|uniref:Uncharacterized protein n=1 Tax=Acidithiobacillus ferrivorans TaxID=160808 RepID=A0A1B9C0B8_9PROT|nr:hypothetical protein [Acidithiobacillus ferrivorans]OCB03398.1 hypothetical protein BBC27_07995 [Acidithiobacillus ferrivorans]
MFREYTVIKDGVIQDEKVCIKQVFEAAQAAGIAVDDMDKFADVLNGHPVLVNGVCMSFLDHIRMRQRWDDLQANDFNAEESARRPWLLNR